MSDPLDSNGLPLNQQGGRLRESDGHFVTTDLITKPCGHCEVPTPHLVQTWHSNCGQFNDLKRTCTVCKWEGWAAGYCCWQKDEPDDADAPTGPTTSTPLTKREYFAALAMQAMLSLEGPNNSRVAVNFIAKMAVACADELARELGEPEEPDA